MNKEQVTTMGRLRSKNQEEKIIMKTSTKITADMTINEVLKISKQAAGVLMGFGMHCFGCPMARSETIAEATAAHGADLELMLEKLNETVGDNACGGCCRKGC